MVIDMLNTMNSNGFIYVNKIRCSFRVAGKGQVSMSHIKTISEGDGECVIISLADAEVFACQLILFMLFSITYHAKNFL